MVPRVLRAGLVAAGHGDAEQSMSFMLIIHAVALSQPVLPVISDTFTVHTVEYDDSLNKTVVKQTIRRDDKAMRSYMIADGLLTRGHLEEAMRCDLRPEGYALSAHGAEGSPPNTWQCTNQTINPSTCNFGNFWALPSNATWAGQVDYNDTLAANVFVYWDMGELHQFLATLDGTRPLRMQSLTSFHPHASKWHIDFVGYSSTPPPRSAFEPPAGLPKCTSGGEQTSQQHAGLSLVSLARAAAKRAGRS